jgi:hypothetical protein
MRSSFVVENRGFLKLCSGAARFYGLFLLSVCGVFVAVAIGMMVAGVIDAHTLRKWIDVQLLSGGLTLVSGGFLSLVLAEFISYVLDGEGEPKWILRNGDKIVYAYVVFCAVISFLTVVHMSRRLGPTGLSFLPVMFAVVHDVTKPLILIGFAITLKRVLPIIRESKLLV